MERTDISFSFENVIAWQKAHQFALLAYRATQKFPPAERYGLCSQFQRAAVSISANIAEGYKKLSKADKFASLTYLKEVWKSVETIFFS